MAGKNSVIGSLFMLVMTMTSETNLGRPSYSELRTRVGSVASEYTEHDTVAVLMVVTVSLTFFGSMSSSGALYFIFTVFHPA